MADNAPDSPPNCAPDTTAPQTEDAPIVSSATSSRDAETDKAPKSKYSSPFEGPNSLQSLHKMRVMIEKMSFPPRRTFDEMDGEGEGEDDYEARRQKHYDMCDNLPPLKVPKRARRHRQDRVVEDEGTTIAHYPPPAYWEELKRQERLDRTKELLDQDPFDFQGFVRAVLPGFLQWEFVGSGALLKPWQLEGCLKLVEETSSVDYKASSSGWNPVEKKKEMADPKMVYLLLTSITHWPTVEGFISFMFTSDDPPDIWRSVVYIYEVHLRGHFRGRGLGLSLIKFVELVAKKNQHFKTMLTVFRTNKGARALYEKLGYSKDVSSPADKVIRRRVIEAEYSIMSKQLVDRF